MGPTSHQTPLKTTHKKAAHDVLHGLLLCVQLPVPPPAPPVPPPAAPVPPPAPDPDPLAPPEVPVPLPALLPDAGEPGVLSGGRDGPRVAPDWVPVASVPWPETA
ncbi:hypothetical protein CUN61_15170 [Pseudomonas arsenicoxydans]|uniref:Uncharacterized protein n=1 Tax=Pseudomonas arsenicoxydans TaxID=702115 RepID=A0A4P6G517_9PSED|nr:hypothetical protein CUN61_15170 [Pseudomonas arsenicoxydans]